MSRDPNTYGKTSRRADTLGGREVFAGTRIPVSAVRAFLREGYSTAAIIAEYPSLVAEDIDLVRQRMGVATKVTEG